MTLTNRFKKNFSTVLVPLGRPCHERFAVDGDFKSLRIFLSTSVRYVRAAVLNRLVLFR